MEMYPASLSASSPPSSILASSPGGTSSTRTGRLRGLSYLRHYTHSHHHNSTNSSSSSSRAAPTVVTTTATASPTAAAPQHHHQHQGTSTSSATPGNCTATQHQQQQQASNPVQTPRTQRRVTSPLNNAESNSWIPTVSGVSGLSRLASLPAAELSTSSVHATNVSGGTTSPGPHNPEGQQNQVNIDAALANDDTTSAMTRATTLTVPGHQGTSPTTVELAEPQSFSIRFSPHLDHRSTRQSLQFSPIERTLKQPDERIRVGRFNDRDAKSPGAPVGFKSKVVSRRHCEFWCENGQWFVKDVKSSSGTFLNHVRLSAPGMESKPFPLQDGDVLQLGIDFKGGEEQIFRCVQIRVELNRAWQRALNNFNMSAHRRLSSLAHNVHKDSDNHSLNTSECAICLFTVAPCQSLFVAPCSHVWHYKCIRPVIEKHYPIFLCPNCRAVADLDREIEEDEGLGGQEIWGSVPDDCGSRAEVQSQATTTNATAGTVGPGEPTTALATVTAAADNLTAAGAPRLDNLIVAGGVPAPVPEAAEPPPEQAVPPRDPGTPTPARPTVEASNAQAAGANAQAPAAPSTPPNHTSSWGRRRRADMILANARDGSEGSGEDSGTSSGGENGAEGPMTPMNDAGPFILDGNDGRLARESRRETLFAPMDGTPMAATASSVVPAPLPPGSAY